MENFIEQEITNPLLEAMSRGIQGSPLAFEGRLISALDFCYREYDSFSMSKRMRYFYRCLFYADPSVMDYGKSEVRSVILNAMKSDNHFKEWAESEMDLLESAHAWAEYCRQLCDSKRDYFDLFEVLSFTEYNDSWKALKIGLKRIFINQQIEGNQYSREVYCILHAFVMIWEKDIDSEKKDELFRLFREHWNFLRFLYSVMLHQVVACGFNNFASIGNQLKSHPSYQPYIHLFYSAIMEHKEAICKNGTKRDKLEKSLADIREIIGSTPRSDELDELCDILFSSRLKQYLDKHRPKSYRELENEVNTLRSNLEKNANEMQELINRQVEMLSETSIPIEVIYDELKNLSERFPGMAYEVYEKLNALLIKNDTWAKNSAKIRDMIWEKISQPSVQATHYYAAGAQHNDNQKHLHVANDKKQIEQA